MHCAKQGLAPHLQILLPGLQRGTETLYEQTRCTGRANSAAYTCGGLSIREAQKTAGPCLLLLYSVIYTAGCSLKGPEQTDCAGAVRVQSVPRVISHHQVQTQNPVQKEAHIVLDRFTRAYS